jgi:hypothetical protein
MDCVSILVIQTGSSCQWKLRGDAVVFPTKPTMSRNCKRYSVAWSWRLLPVVRLSLVCDKALSSSPASLLCLTSLRISGAGRPLTSIATLVISSRTDLAPWPTTPQMDAFYLPAKARLQLEFLLSFNINVSSLRSTHCRKG